MTPICTHILVFVSSSLLPKRINQQHLNYRFFFATFRVLSLAEKMSNNIFFWREKPFFLKVLDHLLRLKKYLMGSFSNWYKQWMNSTNIPCNHKQLHIFRNFSGLREGQNLFLGVTKQRFLFTRFPLLFHAGWDNAQ